MVVEQEQIRRIEDKLDHINDTVVALVARLEVILPSLVTGEALGAAFSEHARKCGGSIESAATWKKIGMLIGAALAALAGGVAIGGSGGIF